MPIGSKLEDIQRFVNYADPEDEQSEIVWGLVAQHTPANRQRIKHPLMRAYSPEAYEGYEIRLVPKQLEDGSWVGKMEFGGNWDPQITGPLTKMNLVYDEPTNSLKNLDEIIVAEGSLKIVLYKVHRVVGRDPNKFGLRDTLTWQVDEPGHADEGFQFATAYVWC